MSLSCPRLCSTHTDRRTGRGRGGSPPCSCSRTCRTCRSTAGHSLRCSSNTRSQLPNKQECERMNLAHAKSLVGEAARRTTSHGPTSSESCRSWWSGGSRYSRWPLESDSGLSCRSGEASGTLWTREAWQTVGSSASRNAGDTWCLQTILHLVGRIYLNTTPVYKTTAFQP